ncbi:MAG: ABC transporter ATP-binding protein [Chloroflexi bacterium]|nr:MAG: ABC transporter ATP-binding protein [Chloroflexota bacterium]
MSLLAQVRLTRGSLVLDLEVAAHEGEVVAVLGPNGAGKTSLLRALAGLLPLTEGRITLDGMVLEDPGATIFVPPEQRRVGMVFQDYLLFPHLSVLENVAFGLRSRGVRAATTRARGWLERVGLADLADVRPTALSGGQAQRVALARALATEPRLLLLDEPLSALDVTIRADTRRDLRRHLANVSGIRLVVTHDPLEAMALADRLMVIEGGRLVQSGRAAEVTARPRSRYVADLVGVNLFRGRAKGTEVELETGGALTVADQAHGDVFAVIHPRAVAVFRQRPDGTPRNVWPLRAVDIDLHGDRVRVRLMGTVTIVAEVTPAALADLGLAEGRKVWAAVKATEISVYPA